MTSAAGQSLTLANGRRVGFLLRGPQDGVPVVYVHGWPGCRLESLLMPDEALTRYDVRLISIDRPGYGDTEPLMGTRAERMADVLGVCDHLGIEELSVIGSSCGGGNGVALAASAPTRVKRVVLSSGQMPYDDLSALEGMAHDQLDELGKVADGRTPELVVEEEQWRQQMLADGAAAVLGEEGFSRVELEWLAQRWVMQVLDADVREAVRASVDGLISDFLISATPFEFSLDAVQCPVYAVHGTADTWEPLTNLRRIIDQLDAELILLDGMGHMGPLLYPDLLLALAVGTREN